MKLLNIDQVKKILLIIFYVVVFFSAIVLIYDKLFGKSEYQKILEGEVKTLQKEQKILKDNQEKNYLKLDSIDKRIEESEATQDKIIERYYYNKEVLNQKIEKNEKDISNINISPDSIQKYLTNFRYTPFYISR